MPPIPKPSWMPAFVKYCLLLTSILCLAEVSSAQVNYSLGAGLGGNVYRGELSVAGGSPAFNFQLFVDSYLENRLFIRGAFNYGRIEGSFEPGDVIIDPSEQDPNFEVVDYFYANIVSAEGHVFYEVISRDFLTISGGIGLGAMNFTTRDDQGRSYKNQSNTRVLNESYSENGVYAPLSISLSLFNSNSFNIMLERSWIFTNTDYLDNIGYSGEPGSDRIIRNSLSLRYHF